MAGKTITFRQYLYFGSIERGMSGKDAEEFVQRYIAIHPNAKMGERATQDQWENRRKAGTLS